MARINVVSDVTGTVWKIEASIGSNLAADDTIMVVESMKMEIPVTATQGGKLLELLVNEADLVNEGQTVAVLET